ncbi:GNAT family N-acetyltransferase [Candidatus Odyssella thessalonicensis]|uniref:GNAT family N-acetyltransferase n=1 Tax=Candidatus Odyssella thessalonicensis TaxID=84647 RepID=UPI000225AEE1|nr:GNAT family N-acetyltransferase [Candidatus Odyssella thessalonicensis]
MRNIKRSFFPASLLATLLGLPLTPQDVQASQFASAIFSFDNQAEATGLHVKLSGSFNSGSWIVREINSEDIPFHQELFDNETVMKGFADGQRRDVNLTKSRCEDSINNRFGKGHPHGLMMVLVNGEQRAMHMVAGGGDRPGTSEIAYASLPEFWGQALGKSLVTAIINEWAPEVRRLGLGQELNGDADANIRQAFQCFGGKELEQLDATASPSNVASWKILTGLGFEAAQCNVPNPEEIIADYDHKDFGGSLKQNYEALETELLTLFNNGEESSQQLKARQRYVMIDLDGKKRVFSKHVRWDRIKFHFEKKLS